MMAPVLVVLAPEAVFNDRQRGRSDRTRENQQPVHQKAARGPLFLYRYPGSALDPEPGFLR